MWFTGTLNSIAFDINLNLFSAMEILDFITSMGASLADRNPGSPLLWRIVPSVSIGLGVTFPDGYIHEYINSQKTNIDPLSENLLYSTLSLSVDFIINKHINLNCAMINHGYNAESLFGLQGYPRLYQQFSIGIEYTF